ncbi:hypothetical protein [Staphylococcus warneri]|uniref:hypothetical protein n=1 Tax=Staphylococcus warneri TaxID=1292 RepID=UPI001A8CD849|nr:hypothetical protein [Staphylococcus warneri]MBO0377070.1 hypothetical protein [Staphylococcus warneri]HCU8763829.1 hypothetical protein [Staphylococcus aureus]
MVLIEQAPQKNISNLKKSPNAVFKEAEEKNSPIFVMKHSNVAGVVLSDELYTTLVNTIKDYEDEIDNLKIANRIDNENKVLYKDEEVRNIISRNIPTDDNDGWE